MTSSAAIAGADLGACFDLFERSAFRLETLPVYAVAAEDERLRAFRLGLPRPERSVRTSPWLARIAGHHQSREVLASGPSSRPPAHRVRALSDDRLPGVGRGGRRDPDRGALGASRTSQAGS